MGTWSVRADDRRLGLTLVMIMKMQHVPDVNWGELMKSLKREKDEFEPNSEMYGEPVKLMKYWCDVVIFLGSSNQASSSILH